LDTVVKQYCRYYVYIYELDHQGLELQIGEITKYAVDDTAKENSYLILQFLPFGGCFSIALM